jgi:hypothetical protein
MAMTPEAPRSRTLFLVAVGIATVLGLWLRAWGVTSQVVIDDEWHALHKLVEASYSGIFKSFGLSDHSIPLTLFYKWMANNVGLAEGRLRLPQVICGVALVPVCAWFALAATRDRAVAALFAFLVCGAPFLVLWSRFARPYAISLLLVVLCVACIWRWRSKRTNALAACAALTAALATWFHPLMGMYPAIACIYVFVEDLSSPAEVRSRAWRQSFKFGAGVAAAMGALLIYPLYKDRESLAAKSGGDYPGFGTFERMFSIFWGGLPAPAYAIALAATAWGLVVLFRRQPRLALCLAMLGVLPVVILTAVGAAWMSAGQNLGRYVLPLQPLLLFLGSLGAVSAARSLAGRREEGAAWIASFVIAAGYLAVTPAIAYTAKLGTWYGHLDYHWDYRERWQAYKHSHPNLDPPDFYRGLGTMSPGAIVEAPFEFEAPYNPLAYYATYHHQNEYFGMIQDACHKEGPRLGEVAPGDRRFRFRRFVFLDNPATVRATGAHYLIFNRDIPTRPVPLPPDCLARLTEIYGPPFRLDARVAVWELNR